MCVTAGPPRGRAGDALLLSLAGCLNSFISCYFLRQICILWNHLLEAGSQHAGILSVCDARMFVEVSVGRNPSALEQLCEHLAYGECDLGVKPEHLQRSVQLCRYS